MFLRSVLIVVLLCSITGCQKRNGWFIPKPPQFEPATDKSELNPVGDTDPAAQK